MVVLFFFSPLACLNALSPSDFFLVPELLNHPKLLDAIWGVFLPLYQSSPLGRDPGCDPYTAPAFLCSRMVVALPRAWRVRLV